MKKQILSSPYLPPNPLRPRAFGGKGAEGLKKQILSSHLAELVAALGAKIHGIVGEEIGLVWAFHERSLVTVVSRVHPFASPFG